MRAQIREEGSADLADALFNRGSAYGNKGKHDLAVRDLDRAGKVEPANPIHWNGRCRERAVIGELPQALASLRCQRRIFI